MMIIKAQNKTKVHDDHDELLEFSKQKKIDLKNTMNIYMEKTTLGSNYFQSSAEIHLSVKKKFSDDSWMMI